MLVIREKFINSIPRFTILVGKHTCAYKYTIWITTGICLVIIIL